MTETRAKYGNKPTEVDGIRFDSKREAERYKELLLMEKAGEITNLKCQFVFVLQPAFRDLQGKRQAAIKYVADFVYAEGWHMVAEDVKGVTTAVFALKAKLFKYRYPGIELRIVR